MDSERAETAEHLWLNRSEAGAAACSTNVLGLAGGLNRTFVLLFLNSHLNRWPSGGADGKKSKQRLGGSLTIVRSKNVSVRYFRPLSDMSSPGSFCLSAANTGRIISRIVEVRKQGRAFLVIVSSTFWNEVRTMGLSPFLGRRCLPPAWTVVERAPAAVQASMRRRLVGRELSKQIASLPSTGAKSLLHAV